CNLANVLLHARRAVLVGGESLLEAREVGLQRRDPLLLMSGANVCLNSERGGGERDDHGYAGDEARRPLRIAVARLPEPARSAPGHPRRGARRRGTASSFGNTHVSLYTAGLHLSHPSPSLAGPADNVPTVTNSVNLAKA